MLVRDYLDLPAHANADDFIVRPQSDDAELARTYTLTHAIRGRLETLLREVKGATDRNEDIGRFIFGSFGSGKSHFLRIAGMLLAGDERLYQFAQDPGLRALHDAHHWLDDAGLLVVQVSMIGVNEDPSAFTRELAKQFDRTLEAKHQPPLRTFGVVSAFEHFDRLTTANASLFDTFENQTGYTRAFYEQQRARAHAGIDVSAFARDVARFLMGDEHQFEPSDSEAREQMAAHAKALGYRGVVFAIDEFILWVQGLSFEGYAAAVNALNALVESADLRPARFIVLTAIQRSIMTVFPEDRAEQALREQLARIKDRFPDVYLEDSNLFEIAERRVLIPKPQYAQEWKQEVTRVARDLADAKGGVLIGDEPAAALAQIYPFHPALMRVLSDVSQGLHRARSSLFMLYQLLAEVRPELKMGELVSLAALWEVLFSEEHRTSLENYAPKNDPTHHANRLLKTYATWERLRPAIAQAAEGERQARTLDAAVKSALLAQLSHTRFLDEFRGLDQAITIENLFRLNRADVSAMNEAVGIIRMGELLAKLAAAEPGTVIVDGTGPGAVVRIELNAIDLSELLSSLRPANLYPTMLANVKQVLGLANIGASEGRLTTSFRSSDRSGRVKFETLEQLTASGRESTLAVDPNDEFKVAVAIEHEIAGSVQEQIDNARSRIESARDQAQTWSAAWLPGPLSTEGREALETLAKIALFDERPDDYLTRFRAGEQPLVRQRLAAMKSNAQASLHAALKLAYGDGARVVTMRQDPGELFPPNVDLSGRAKQFAAMLLERRYPQHPRFSAAPNPSHLTKLLALVQRLLNDPSNNALTGEDADLVKRLGQPLELFEPGVGVTNLKTGGLYLDRLSEWVEAGEHSVRVLIERLAREPIGLQRAPAQLVIAVLALRMGYRVLLDGRVTQLAAVGDIDPRAELSRSRLPSTASWTTALNTAITLFRIVGVPPALNVNSVDALITACREPLARGRELAKRCVDALNALSRKCDLERSEAHEAYAGLLRELASLDETQFVERLAVLDVEQVRPVLAAAEKDALALESIKGYHLLGSVLNASEPLRTSICNSLVAGSPPLQTDIARWMKAAEEFIESRLGVEPADPLAPPPPPPSVVKVERHLSLPLRDVDVLSVLAEARADWESRGLVSGPVIFSIELRPDGEPT